MHRRTARGNRLGLTITGILLALAGAALFAGNRGYFGSGSSSSPLYPEAARRFIHDNGTWLWPVVAAVAVIVGLLFLRWLLVQPRTDKLRRLTVDTEDANDSGAGRTKMPATALTDIIEDDIAALRGVRKASAALSGHVDVPQLWLRVSADADADLAEIRRRITGEVLTDARTSLEVSELRTYLRLAVSRRAGARQVH